MTGSNHQRAESSVEDFIPDEGLAPVRTLPFEPAQALSLQWLPLAVRYKLDRCGLRISLADWQALSLAQRAALVAAPLGVEGERERFADCLLQCTRPAQASAGPRLAPEVIHPSFAQYVCAKRAKKTRRAHAGSTAVFVPTSC